MDRIVSKVAFYVTARKSRTLVLLPTSTLDALLTFLPGCRRVARFGAWRRRTRRPPNPQPASNDESERHHE